MSEQPPAKPSAHLDAPNAELYRRVMGVFVADKRRFLGHLRPEDLAASLEEAGGVPVRGAGARPRRGPQPAA